LDRTIDFIIIAVYLFGVAVFGLVTGGKQKTVDDYFLGAKKIPWWIVSFSIVATETSSLTFISIPGLAYLTNFNFLQLAFGFLLGRIFIAYYLLPSYFQGEFTTAYSYLGKRFGNKTRTYASIVFLFTRTAADSVRLFATAIPLKLLLNISYPEAILIIAAVALLYTITGGLKSVIWVDAVQMLVYIGGALIAIYFLLFRLIPGGWDTVVNFKNIGEKVSVINWEFSGGIKGFFSTPYTFIAGLIGGGLLSMASHGTDQLIVQRLLATKDLSKSQRAIIGSGVLIIIQFAIFLFLGVLLFVLYKGASLHSLGLTKSDEIFPQFIINKIPVGISGIIIAGLLAAAMSTLAGSISALSSSTMLDIFPLFKKKFSETKKLKISRMFSLMWAVILIFAALLFLETSTSVVELALSIASYTYGGLLGTFLLGRFVKKAKQEDALAGFTAGIFVMISVIMLHIVAWTWFLLIGVSITVFVGSLLSSIPKGNNKHDI